MSEATGLLKGFSVSSQGWTVIDLDGAPKGISTKRQNVVDAVKELVGQNVTARWTESEGKINENTGKPYINRMLDSVVPAQPAQDPAPAVTPAAPDHAAAASPSTAGPGYSKDTDIRRQAIVKGIGGRQYKNIAEFIEWANAVESWILSKPAPAFGASDDPDSDIPF